MCSHIPSWRRCVGHLFQLFPRASNGEGDRDNRNALHFSAPRSRALFFFACVSKEGHGKQADKRDRQYLPHGVTPLTSRCETGGGFDRQILKATRVPNLFMSRCSE